MILVRTRKGPSKIEGEGLFADEFITKGTPVWRFKPGFDLKLTLREISTLSPEAQEEYKAYGYLSKKSGKYILCSDDARLINHSEYPNVQAIYSDAEEEDLDIALRDIERGEELTLDYREFDAEFPTS